MNEQFVTRLVGVVLGLVLGAFVTWALVASKYQHEAIQHGAAQYNPTNAVFEWKDSAR